MWGSCENVSICVSETEAGHDVLQKLDFLCWSSRAYLGKALMVRGNVGQRRKSKPYNYFNFYRQGDGDSLSAVYNPIVYL